MTGEWSKPLLIGCEGVCAVAGQPLLGSTRHVEERTGVVMSKHTLGIDLGCGRRMWPRCVMRGDVIWSRRRLRNRHDELEAVVDQVGDCDQLTVW